MASTGRLNLYTATALAAASTQGDRTGALPARSRNLLAWIKSASVNAATTISGKIQHSPNGGTDWVDLVVFADHVGVAAVQAIPVTVPVFPHLRADITLAGVTKLADVLIDLFYEPV